MRLVAYVERGQQVIGGLLGDGERTRVVNLQAAYAGRLFRVETDPMAWPVAAVRIPQDMVRFIEGGEEAWDAARRGLEWAEKGLENGDFEAPLLSSVKLKAPLRPKIIICGGANFDDHLDETRRQKPDHVEFFLKAAHTVVGPGETVGADERLSRKYDYEVELGIVIGKAGKRIPRDRIYDYIFGYTIFNDISARDRQIIPWGGKNPFVETETGKGGFQTRFGEGKNYDSGGPVGPWIVSKDEIPDPSNLALKTTVSGELRQNNNTRNLLWNVPELVAYYSTFLTLQPGMLIASGTPGGPALGSDTELGADPYERKDGVLRGRYLQAGDIIRCEVEKIGVLENPVGH
ncbi:MAG: fumarylacetoacetate hydrolase family protein [Nitrospinota bacterium]